MNKSRRLFLQQALGSTVLLSLGKAQGFENIIRQEAQHKIKGVGVDEGVVQLIWNENPLGPSPKAVEAVSKGLFASNRYHDPDEIEKVVAEHHGIYDKFVTKGVGATEILYR